MKKIDWELILALIVSIIPVMMICWFIHKVFAGIYYLLDKLIDKI